MTAPLVIGPNAGDEEGTPVRPKLSVEDTAIWSILGWIGIVILAVGSADIVLTWYPTSFGDFEWEFGTVSASFNGLPTVTLGMGLWLAAALKGGRRRLSLALSAGFALLAVLVVLAAMLYATTAPVALSSVAGTAVEIGLKKAVAKTTIQGLFYPIGFLLIGWKGFRTAKSGS